MPYHPLHRSAEQSAVLRHALARAEALGSRGTALFDLDGCLFDNRPRQIRILRQLAARRGLFELWRIEPEHFLDWHLARTFEAAGLPPAFADAHLDAVQRWWDAHFYRPEMLVLDHAMPGATQFVRAIRDRGCAIAYLTGRTTEARDGTLAALESFGFPVHDATLRMRESLDVGEVAFKTSAFDSTEGLPFLFMDNHPGNTAAFARRFPDALAVLVDTGHDGLLEPPPGVARILGFLYD